MIYLVLWIIGAVPVLFAGSLPGLEGEVPEGFVAKGEGLEIESKEYYEYLDSRLRTQDLGKSLFKQLIHEIAIENEARRRGIEATDGELDRKVKLLERQIRVSSGGAKGLDEYLREQGVDKGDFMRALRLSIAHEGMARTDFDIPADEEVPVEKQNVWLKELLNRTEIETESTQPGIVVQVDGTKITTIHFGRRLSTLLSPEKASDLLTELIGIRLIRMKARDMSIRLEESDCEREITEREALLRAKPGFDGITYEQYLKAASGQTLDGLRSSDKFRAEVLLKKICESLHHEAYLQEYYEKHRTIFNRKYGRAARISTIFLRAVKFDNQLTEKYKFTDRKFDEALEELKAIKTRLEGGEVIFENLARIYSEHETAKSGGDLGFIPPGTEGWEDVAEAALSAEKGGILGPFTFPEGCHLIKVCDKREDPTYVVIRDAVKRDARQRFYDRLIQDAKVKRLF